MVDFFSVFLLLIAYSVYSSDHVMFSLLGAQNGIATFLEPVPDTVTQNNTQIPVSINVYNACEINSFNSSTVWSFFSKTFSFAMPQ